MKIVIWEKIIIIYERKPSILCRCSVLFNQTSSHSKGIEHKFLHIKYVGEESSVTGCQTDHSKRKITNKLECKQRDDDKTYRY